MAASRRCPRCHLDLIYDGVGYVSSSGPVDLYKCKNCGFTFYVAADGSLQEFRKPPGLEDIEHYKPI